MKARTMFRRPGCACRVSVAVVLLLSVPVVAFPGGIEIDCEGSRQAYKRDPNLRHLICTCSSPNASPKCTDPSSGSGSSGSSGGSQSSSRGSGGGSHMSSTNQAVLNGIREGLDAMFKPNPAALQRIQQTQTEGAQAQQQDQLSQQGALEQHRATAAQKAEAARREQLKGLAGSLLGVPSNAGIELLREGASSGFDTAGAMYGTLPAPPPPVPPPTIVPLPASGDIPPGKMTPQVSGLLREREQIREKKKGIEEELKRMEVKERPSPEESKAMVNLRKDLFAALAREKENDELTRKALEAQREAEAALERANQVGGAVPVR